MEMSFLNLLKQYYAFFETSLNFDKLKVKKTTLGIMFKLAMSLFSLQFIVCNLILIYHYHINIMSYLDKKLKRNANKTVHYCPIKYYGTRF